MSRRSPSKTPDAVWAFAASLPDVTESVACEGTALEKRTLKVMSKAFFFLGPGNLMLKLGESLAEFPESGDAVKAGSGGWTTVRFGTQDEPPGLRILKKWALESYNLFAKPREKA